MDICQMAQHQDFEHAGQRLRQGEVLLSVRTMAKRWGWSTSRTSRFINSLCSGAKSRTGRAQVAHRSVLSSGTPSDPMLDLVSGTPRGSIYRIVKYDTYAIRSEVERDTPSIGDRDTERDTERDTRGTPAGHARDKNNNEQGTMNLNCSPKESKKEGRKNAGSIPKGWAPNETHRKIAQEEGVDIKREAVTFRDHAKANGRTLKDWDAGFCNWLRKANTFPSGGQGRRRTESGATERPLLSGWDPDS